MAKIEKKSYYLAKISLGVMGTGFLITMPFQGSYIGGLLQGGFEAGLVGGLADWFAVTALFRHPLGMPIPHTALLQKNRDRIIDSLVSMIENDWLTKESIQEKIKQIKLADKLLQITENELSSDNFKRGISSILHKTITDADLEKIVPFIEEELKEYLHTFDATKLIQSLVNQALDRKLDEKTLDYILTETEKLVEKEETKAKIGIMAKQLLENINVDGFLKLALNSFMGLMDEKMLGKMLQPLILKKVILLKNDDDQYRHLILSRIHQELESIQEREELVTEINDWKDTLLSNWNLSDQVKEALKKLQNKLILLTLDDEFIDKYVLSFIKNIINKMKEAPEKTEKIEKWTQKQIFDFIDKNHSRIGGLVKENLEKLDNETLTNMIENSVGKDLQWIRVNGAICGFFIGIILAIIKTIV